jgi:Zn-dependent protease
MITLAALELPPMPVFAAMIVVIFFGLGLHEFAHAKLADMAGDPTPGSYGRVTLNLFKHFDPVGTIMILITSIAGVGIGWGKPVPMDPRKMQNPKWDHFVAVLGGPLSNLAQASVYAVVWRVMYKNSALLPAALSGEGGFLPALLAYGILINLSLCVFNLIPIGPLDGMWIAGTFMPEKTRFYWTRWNLTSGQFAFLALVLMGQLTDFSIISKVMAPPMQFLLRLLTG